MPVPKRFDFADSPLEGTRFELLVPLRDFPAQCAHRRWRAKAEARADQILGTVVTTDPTASPFVRLTTLKKPMRRMEELDLVKEQWAAFRLPDRSWSTTHNPRTHSSELAFR
jgi:hypothetical protein